MANHNSAEYAVSCWRVQVDIGSVPRCDLHRLLVDDGLLCYRIRNGNFHGHGIDYSMTGKRVRKLKEIKIGYAGVKAAVQRRFVTFDIE